MFPRDENLVMRAWLLMCGGEEWPLYVHESFVYAYVNKRALP